VFVNKILALSQLAQMQMSFPKVVYDKTRIREWTNKVAGAIPVNGDISGAAQYLGLPGSGYDAWKGLNATLETTMRMMGANEVTLGNIKNPENTSAFIATRDAAMVPLQSQQERFYNFIEDVGLIWLDFIQQYYTAGRMIPIEAEGQRVYVPIPEDALKPYTLRLKLDVGPSSTWSEVQTLQSLDNLLKAGKLSLKQYLERIPDGHIPKKAELLAEAEAAENAGKGGGAPQAGPLPQGAPGLQAAVSGVQPAGIPAPQPGGGDTGALMAYIHEGASAGRVSPQAAKDAEELAAQGAPADVIVGALARAAAEGRADRAFVDELLLRARPGTSNKASEAFAAPRT
jgi:hypothetical protein